jgi:hypothetical protein
VSRVTCPATDDGHGHDDMEFGVLTPLEIMPRCSAAGSDFRIIPGGFNAPLEFLTGLTSNAMLYALCAMQSSLSDAHQGEDSSQTKEDGWNPCGEERRENP